MPEADPFESEGAQEVKCSAEAVLTEDRVEQLAADKQKIKTHLDYAASWVPKAIVRCVGAAAGVVFLWRLQVELNEHHISFPHWAGVALILIWTLLAGYSLTMFGVVISSLRRKKALEATIEDLDFEIDLLRFPVKSVETRAEKTLLQHNKQLRRYYNQNLGENEKVFWVGIACIALGFVIIYVTISLVSQTGTTTSQMDTKSKIIVAVLGAVGSLLSNYIAAIYLKMHAAATSNLGRFHGRLVETHQVLFANLVASRIENDKIRWDTLSKVAIGLTKPLKPEPKDKDSSRRRRNAAGKSALVDDVAEEGKDETENAGETD